MAAFLSVSNELGLDNVEALELLAAVWLICTVFGSIAANAHDFPVDRVMNGFIKISPHQADLVIRIPLDLLNGVPFPMAGDNYDIAASGPAVEGALKNLAISLELWEGDVLLVPSSTKGTLTPLADRSFREYDEAVAQVNQPATSDTVIGYDLGYLDVHFVYPISSPESGVLDRKQRCGRSGRLRHDRYPLYSARRIQSSDDHKWHGRPRDA